MGVAVGVLAGGLDCIVLELSLALGGGGMLGRLVSEAPLAGVGNAPGCGGGGPSCSAAVVCVGVGCGM